MKLNPYQSYDLVIYLSNTDPREIKMYVHTNLNMNVPNHVLLKRQKNLKATQVSVSQCVCV